MSEIPERPCFGRDGKALRDEHGSIVTRRVMDAAETLERERMNRENTAEFLAARAQALPKTNTFEACTYEARESPPGPARWGSD